MLTYSPYKASPSRPSTSGQGNMNLPVRSSERFTSASPASSYYSPPPTQTSLQQQRPATTTKGGPPPSLVRQVSSGNIKEQFIHPLVPVAGRRKSIADYVIEVDKDISNDVAHTLEVMEFNRAALRKETRKNMSSSSSSSSSFLGSSAALLGNSLTASFVTGGTLKRSQSFKNGGTGWADNNNNTIARGRTIGKGGGGGGEGMASSSSSSSTSTAGPHQQQQQVHSTSNAITSPTSNHSNNNNAKRSKHSLKFRLWLAMHGKHAQTFLNDDEDDDFMKKNVNTENMIDKYKWLTDAKTVPFMSTSGRGDQEFPGGGGSGAENTTAANAVPFLSNPREKKLLVLPLIPPFIKSPSFLGGYTSATTSNYNTNNNGFRPNTSIEGARFSSGSKYNNKNTSTTNHTPAINSRISNIEQCYENQCPPRFAVFHSLGTTLNGNTSRRLRSKSRMGGGSGGSGGRTAGGRPQSSLSSTTAHHAGRSSSTANSGPKWTMGLSSTLPATLGIIADSSVMPPLPSSSSSRPMRGTFSSPVGKSLVHLPAVKNHEKSNNNTTTDVHNAAAAIMPTTPYSGQTFNNSIPTFLPSPVPVPLSPQLMMQTVNLSDTVPLSSYHKNKNNACVASSSSIPINITSSSYVSPGTTTTTTLHRTSLQPQQQQQPHQSLFEGAGQMWTGKQPQPPQQSSSSSGGSRTGGGARSTSGAESGMPKPAPSPSVTSKSNSATTSRQRNPDSTVSDDYDEGQQQEEAVAQFIRKSIVANTRRHALVPVLPFERLRSSGSNKAGGLVPLVQPAISKTMKHTTTTSSNSSTHSRIFGTSTGGGAKKTEQQAASSYMNGGRKEIGGNSGNNNNTGPNTGKHHHDHHHHSSIKSPSSSTTSTTVYLPRPTTTPLPPLLHYSTSFQITKQQQQNGVSSSSSPSDINQYLYGAKISP